MSTTYSGSKLGRARATVPCQCCSDSRIEKNTAHTREKRAWKQEAWEPEAHKIFDGEPANIARHS